MKELEDLYAYIRRQREELLMLCAVKSKEDEIREAEERGAREMAYLFFKDTHAFPSAIVNEWMQLWREGRK